MGDLSNNDGYVLKDLAEQSNNILEFGVGASTQILRYYCKGEMISVDTSDEWIRRTKVRLKQLEIEEHVKFQMYNDPIKGEFDLIFVDGITDKRLEFALNNWKHLKIGGLMVFHDTRSGWGINLVTDTIRKFLLELSEVKVNASNSNMTILKKSKSIAYENWNKTENRPPWRRAKGEFNTQEFLKWKQNENTKVRSGETRTGE